MPWPKGEFFHCAALDDNVRAELIEEAKMACKYLVVNATTADSAPIDSVVVNVKTGRHATLRRVKDKVDASLDGMVAHTRVRATIDEVSDFFYVDSHAKGQLVSRVMGDRVVDRTRLYSLVERPIVEAASQPLHYVGVEWALQKHPNIPARDTCCLDYQDEFSFMDQTTGDERRGWARCTHSVDIDACPDLEKQFGVIRATVVRSGHVFLESTDSGMLDYFRVLFVDPGGAILKRFAPLVHKNIVKPYGLAVLNLEEHFVKQRMKPMLDMPSHFKEKKEIDYCMQCYGRFKWMSVKKQCRSCGDVVCHKCSSVWAIDLDMVTSVKVDLCQECVTGEPKRPPRETAATSSMSFPSGGGYVHNPTRPHSYRTSMYRPTGEFQPAAMPHQGNQHTAHHMHLPQRSISAGQAPIAAIHNNVCPPMLGENEGDDLDSDIHILSPDQWRRSSSMASSIQDGTLTLRSDSSSIYL
ncbi:Aste57867_22192 [Aphanomyces stellatus]|uniref:Aste57867_22192 protein n=1 Tax=Aphanomyces stellatus TaxID=120398 RepID=A0A485LK82_9STRA|nr:hypothetical protein As57867_022123 [Aphanomyces stellatus]VFT98859.1 Aste57867_22192 [Aphanomyces stellatus]